MLSTTGECLTANQVTKPLHNDTKNKRKAVKCLKSHCNKTFFPTYPTYVNSIIVKTILKSKRLSVLALKHLTALIYAVHKEMVYLPAFFADCSS